MIKEFVRSFSGEVWNIGFVQNNLKGILRGEKLKVKWLKHNFKDRWFADPFILDVTDDEIHVLVEEFYEPIQRGRIARLIIDKNTCVLKRNDLVLELPTHLSFPAIIRKNGKIYIYPENGESGELNLYQYNPETNECTKIKRLLSEPVADAVIRSIDGVDFLFCTKQPCSNGNVLSVYQKDVMGTFVQTDDYPFEECVARMAGDFFEYEGKLYRPTQECNVQYGHAVTLQEVTRENGKFAFREVRRMYSVHPTLTVGMHTFNMYKDVIVTDALGFHNMWIRKILRAVGVL